MNADQMTLELAQDAPRRSMQRLVLPLRVLVACEYSGTVRDSFAARGHDAMSCDILPTDKPGKHYQGDVRDVLDDGCDDMAAASGARLQRLEQPGALRDERDGAQAHGSTGECSGLSGSSIRHAAGAGLPHGVNRSMGEPGTLTESERSDWWATEPNVGRVAHGVAARVDRLRCIGNGQVSRVVPLAWNLLKPKK
jgi:hypothetical protein